MVQCTHEPKAAVIVTAGTKVIALQSCGECMPAIFAARLPAILRKRQPFRVKLTAGNAVLILDGSWEKVPVEDEFFSSKELGGIIKLALVKNEKDSGHEN